MKDDVQRAQKVVVIEDTAKGGTLYVAATGTPYPIAIVSPNNGKDRVDHVRPSGTSPLSISAPKGAIDIGSPLGG